MIEGVIIKPLKKIPDERGAILHMLKRTDPEFREFGEIYFSTVYPQVIKGWHKHKKMTLNYAVISGMIKLVLYDDRKKSSTFGEIMEIYTGEEKYELIVIPPLVWNGYKGVGINPAIVANCATHPHDPSEMDRLDPLKNKKIPYDWEMVLK